MAKCHFWADVILRQSRIWASRASPAQKLQGLRVVYSKNFSRATFFVFWVSKLEDSYLNKLPMKQIWRKIVVWDSSSISDVLYQIDNVYFNTFSFCRSQYILCQFKYFGPVAFSTATNELMGQHKNWIY